MLEDKQGTESMSMNERCKHEQGNGKRTSSRYNSSHTGEYKTHGSKDKVGIIMRRMQVLIERDSRSPYEAQKPLSH